MILTDASLKLPVLRLRYNNVSRKIYLEFKKKNLITRVFLLLRARLKLIAAAVAFIIRNR